MVGRARRKATPPRPAAPSRARSRDGSLAPMGAKASWSRLTRPISATRLRSPRERSGASPAIPASALWSPWSSGAVPSAIPRRPCDQDRRRRHCDRQYRREATMHTDENRPFTVVGASFGARHTVNPLANTSAKVSIRTRSRACSPSSSGA